MNQIKMLPLLLLLINLLISCSTQPVNPPKEWFFEEDAISINFKADSKLNIYEGSPHPLSLCIYQLKEPGHIKTILTSEDLTKLIDCRVYTPNVVDSKRYTINPGQDLQVSMDRELGVKLVAIVAGYFMAPPEEIINFFDIPVVVERRALFRNTESSEPGPLDIDIMLGPKKMEYID